MIDYYEWLEVTLADRIRVHPKEGKPFVVEAVPAAKNSCEDCSLFKEGVDCLGLDCPDKVIFKKVEDAEASKGEAAENA